MIVNLKIIRKVEILILLKFLGSTASFSTGTVISSALTIPYVDESYILRVKINYFNHHARS